MHVRFRVQLQVVNESTARKILPVKETVNVEGIFEESLGRFIKTYVDEHPEVGAVSDVVIYVRTLGNV